MQCQECNKKFKNFKALSTHIQLDLVVEIKNSYSAKKFKNIIESKKQSALKHHNYIMIIDKDYEYFNFLYPS